MRLGCHLGAAGESHTCDSGDTLFPAVHLKTLTVTGFKSFADRTRVECEPGVTVVVGPNGSGKSNLVDAIAWVMGTQATSTLRTSRMEDVIFAGTAVRPALGRAEVTLTLDNGSGMLDLDLAEVTLTRRLFRDGTSEYLVNGVACRLLDIQELLHDSGIGRHQHVIVGQGRVDAVLNSGPEEHRAVIEEAAGVVKHRARRDRSMRRLEATEVDVTRLRDLLEEQQRRMRPLKRQAAAAEQYDSVRAEWHSLRLWLGGEHLRNGRNRLAAVVAEEDEIKARIEQAASERDAITGSLAELQAAAGETGEALERDTSAAARLETTAERIHSIALVARERRLHSERSAAGAESRRQDLLAEQADLGRRLDEAVAAEAAAVEAAERSEMALRALEDEERALARADTLPAEGRVAAMRGDLAALEGAELRDHRESGDLARSRGALAAVIAEEVAEARRLEDEAEALAPELAAAERALGAAVATAGRDRDAATIAETAHAAAESALVAARARLEALRAARAGLADPDARRRMTAAVGVAGTLTALLDVPDGLATAVDAALGPWAEALVVAGPGALAEAADRARALGGGGVALVAASASTVGPREMGDAPVLASLMGQGADAALASSLLGDVVLVDDCAAGLAFVASHPGWRAVTASGDLITGNGVLLAHPDGATPAVIAAADRAVEAAATEAARAHSRKVTASRSRDSSAAALKDATERLESLRRRIAAIEEGIRLLERSRSGRTAELDRLDARARALAEASAGRAERIADLRARIADLEGEQAAQQQVWDDMARRLAEVSERRERARRSREDAAATLATVAERRTTIEGRLAEIGSLLTEEAAPFDPAEGARLESVETLARRALAAVRSHVESLRARQRLLRVEAGEAGARLDAARRRRDQLGVELEEARESLSRLAVEAAELKVRDEAIAEALRRDADASEEEALGAPMPEVSAEVDPEARLDSLSARLRRLGPVNPLAAAEYRELAERVEFVEGQLADLEESRRELRKVVRALDEEIARLFEEAFEDIAAKFAENFTLLFPGGTGRLTLTDGDDVLASGVEIHAQPMGKKVGRLQLLSGGERSLAALAFLFAVFRSRPSPFYVLDEVEAALDDANLRRFLRLVDTLRDSSQLVIVTHQQQTMEAADVLYGVTMEPGESSRVLAKRLSPV